MQWLTTCRAILSGTPAARRYPRSPLDVKFIFLCTPIQMDAILADLLICNLRKRSFRRAFVLAALFPGLVDYSSTSEEWYSRLGVYLRRNRGSNLPFANASQQLRQATSCLSMALFFFSGISDKRSNISVRVSVLRSRSIAFPSIQSQGLFFSNPFRGRSEDQLV
jgi:hypothetical protein